MSTTNSKPSTQLSIIILTNRNDRRFIQCLHSSQFAAEILVLDYQSQNDWPALAKKYRFTLINKSEQTIDDFAQARNQALSAAKNPWVLFLDSDESLNRQTAKNLMTLIQSNTPLADAFSLQRIDYFHQQPMKWGEVHKLQLIRLAKKDKLKFIRPVHEVAQIEGLVKKSDLIIKHQAHPSIAEFFTAVSQYAQLEAQYRINNQKFNSLNQATRELFFYPLAKFFLNYILKLGFFDGWPGLIYAVMMSFHSLLVRIFLIEQLTKNHADTK